MSTTTDEEAAAAPHAAALAAAAAAAAAAQHVLTEHKAGDVLVVDAVAAAAAQEAVTATDEAAAAATAATAVATNAATASTVVTDDAAAAVAATLAIGIDVGAAVPSEENTVSQRKFFPRVKQLITNAHWEDFLTTVLQIVDRAGAPECAAASHKKDNAWVVAFADIYAGVARDYSVPQGKNRYHKFKDKVVEVWQALEQLPPGEHSCRVRAVRQLHRHRLAVADHATERHWERQQQQLLHPTSSSSTGLVLGSGSGNGDDNPHSPKKQKRAGPGRPPGSTAAAIHAAALAKLAASAAGRGRGGANTKQSLGTALGGGSSSTVAHAGLVPPNTPLSAGVGSLTWQNLEEHVCLARLPEPLRSLVHFKQLSREMAARTFNRGTRKAIEVHGKTVDTAYLSALQLYIDADATPGKLQKTTQQQQQQQKDTFEDAKEKEEEDDKDEGDADPEEAEATQAQRAHDLFTRAQTMAFLYRYASSLEEQRVLNEEYRKHTAHYILHITRTRGGDDEDVLENASEEEATAGPAETDVDDDDNGTSILTHDAATEVAAIAAAAASAAAVSVPDTHDTMDVDGTTPTAADADTETETYSYTV